jgi:hypothetical protein
MYILYTLSNTGEERECYGSSASLQAVFVTYWDGWGEDIFTKERGIERARERQWLC